MARNECELPNPIRDVTDDESGQGLSEYALILAFIVIVAIAALRALGTTIEASGGFKLFDLI